jgi:hypothetical protein
VRRARQLPGALLAAAPRARRSDGEGGRHVHSHPMSGNLLWDRLRECHYSTQHHASQDTLSDVEGRPMEKK